MRLARTTTVVNMELVNTLPMIKFFCAATVSDYNRAHVYYSSASRLLSLATIRSNLVEDIQVSCSTTLPNANSMIRRDLAEVPEEEVFDPFGNAVDTPEQC